MLFRSEKDYHKWTVEEEKALLEAMRLAKAAGHKSPIGFKKTATNFMMTEVKRLLPDSNLKALSLKNHVKTWRRQLSAILDIKAMSGVSWSDDLKRFDFTDEEWKYYTKVCIGIYCT